METKTQEVAPVVASMLEKLGFTKAATNLKVKAARKRKMAMAYELYRFVRPEKVTEFNLKLHKKTQNYDRMGGYKMLAFMGIQDYEGAPPQSVLLELEKAQSVMVGDMKVFDRFEVAYIKDIPDPILFGTIDGCPDRFYIADWGEDVRIEDLLKDNEG